MTKKIVFIREDRSGALASGRLRTDQLSQIVTEHSGREDIEISVSPLHDDIRNSIVFLSKTAIIDHGHGGIDKLKRAGNRVCLDFVDLSVDYSKCIMADGLVASSWCQFKNFLSVCPKLNTVYLPHHADLRICNPENKSDVFSLVYAGALRNAQHLMELTRKGLCDYLPATDYDDISWIQRCKLYSCHYAVRIESGSEIFKPFTKGITAAVFNAPLITDRSEEAVHCLGADYPYFVPDKSFENIEKTIEFARSSFRQAPWNVAMAILADVKWRYSPPRIAEAFLRFTDNL